MLILKTSIIGDAKISFGEISVSYTSGLGGAVTYGFTFAMKVGNSALFTKS